MKFSDRFYIILVLLLGGVYIRGLFIPLMNNDSAHHANIALHMYLTDDYTSLIDQGKDYLDKPHFHFWLTALSFHVFGVNTFAYKFPSLLFTLLGLYATFQLGTLLYNRETGKLSALILSTALAFILANNDVRMDAILTSCIVFSTWQLLEYVNTKKWVNILFASLGLALGFSTKGMIGAVVPSLTTFVYILFKRNFSILKDRKWIAFPLLFFLFASPVLYSYYLQFDLHPEKVIRGVSGISGVEFILWSQNIERLDGINFGGSGKEDHFFFVHTLLWAFLPWSFMSIAAFWNSLKYYIRNKFCDRSVYDRVTLPVLTVMMILLSFSGFKLPHYLNILFPFFAILTAAYLNNIMSGKNDKLIFSVQVTVFVLMVSLAFVLNGWVLAMDRVSVMITGGVVLLAGMGVWIFSASLKEKAIIISVVTALCCNFLLNFNWYPKLLKYQAGNVLAEKVKDHASATYVFLEGCERSPSFEFYIGRLLSYQPVESVLKSEERVLIYTGPKGLELLKERKARFHIIAAAFDYPVSNLKWQFLDQEKRHEIMPVHCIVEIN